MTRSFSFIFVHPLDPKEGLSSKPKYRENHFEIYIFLFYYFTDLLVRRFFAVRILALTLSHEVLASLETYPRAARERGRETNDRFLLFYIFSIVLFICLVFGFTLVKIYHLEVCYVLMLGTLFSSQGHLTTVSS